MFREISPTNRCFRFQCWVNIYTMWCHTSTVASGSPKRTIRTHAKCSTTGVHRRIVPPTSHPQLPAFSVTPTSWPLTGSTILSMERVNTLWCMSRIQSTNSVRFTPTKCLCLTFELSAPPLELQGRFEQLPAADQHHRMLNATQLRAIAVAENISSIVEFRVRPIAASWRYQMYVIVDKEYVYWWDETMRVQNFRGVTLYQPAGIQNMSHVIAMFDSGAGVEVTAIHGRMTVHVYAPYTFMVSRLSFVFLQLTFGL